MKTQEIPRLIFGPQFSFYRKPIWNTAPYKSVSCTMYTRTSREPTLRRRPNTCGR